MKDTKKTKKLVLIIIIGLVVLALGVSLVSVYIVNTAMKQGKSAYDQDENDLAITNYTRAIKFSFLNKENKADSFLWRGRSYYEKEEYKQALADFTNAIELQKDDYPYYTWRARTHHKMENKDLAIMDYNTAIDIMVETDAYNIWDIYLERADLYSKSKEYDLIIADYEKAILALDKSINSSYISDDKIYELKKKRDDIISKIKYTESFINWKKKNPEGTYSQWVWVSLFENN